MTRENLRKIIVLYGGGYTARSVISWLDLMGNMPVNEVMDSNAKLWGTECTKGIKIKSYIDTLLKMNDDKDKYVIITCFPEDDIYRINLQQNGFEVFSWKEICELFVNSELKREYHVNYEKGLKKWFMGLGEELLFWETAYAKQTARKHNRYLQLVETVYFSEPYLSCKIQEGYTVMDIGSGILSRYGSMLANGKKINLLPVDPLAYWYNLFNKQYLNDEDIEQKEKIGFGIFEGLSCTYANESADVIIISNALDHCIDPFRSILECIKVLKTGGTLLLKHLRREAVNEKEQGLHQWNVDVSDSGDMVLWNNDNYINVTNELKDYINIKITLLEQDERGDVGEFGFLVVEIVKKKSIEENAYDQYGFEEIVKQIEENFKKMVGKDYMDQTMWENALSSIVEE